MTKKLRIVVLDEAAGLSRGKPGNYAEIHWRPTFDIDIYPDD